MEGFFSCDKLSETDITSHTSPQHTRLFFSTCPFCCSICQRIVRDMRPEELNKKRKKTHTLCLSCGLHIHTWVSSQSDNIHTLINAANHIYQRHKMGDRLSHSFNSIIVVFFCLLWFLKSMEDRNSIKERKVD